MSEDSRFGKPMIFLTLLAVGGGGYYFYKTWPVTHTGNGWEVKLPNAWQVTPLPPTEMVVAGITANGPLKEEIPGSAKVTVYTHATINWPQYVYDLLPEVPEEKEEFELNVFKAVLCTYTSGEFKYRALGVDRGDVALIYLIGCPKPFFDENKESFDKLLRKTTLSR